MQDDTADPWSQVLKFHGRDDEGISDGDRAAMRRDYETRSLDTLDADQLRMEIMRLRAHRDRLIGARAFDASNLGDMLDAFEILCTGSDWQGLPRFPDSAPERWRQVEAEIRDLREKAERGDAVRERMTRQLSALPADGSPGALDFYDPVINGFVSLTVQRCNPQAIRDARKRESIGRQFERSMGGGLLDVSKLSDDAFRRFARGSIGQAVTARAAMHAGQAMPSLASAATTGAKIEEREAVKESRSAACSLFARVMAIVTTSHYEQTHRVIEDLASAPAGTMEAIHAINAFQRLYGREPEGDDRIENAAGALLCKDWPEAWRLASAELERLQPKPGADESMAMAFAAGMVGEPSYARPQQITDMDRADTERTRNDVVVGMDYADDGSDVTMMVVVSRGEDGKQTIEEIKRAPVSEDEARDAILYAFAASEDERSELSYLLGQSKPVPDGAFRDNGYYRGRKAHSLMCSGQLSEKMRERHRLAWPACHFWLEGRYDDAWALARQVSLGRESQA